MYSNFFVVLTTNRSSMYVYYMYLLTFIQKVTDAKHKQPIQYAVVDKNKKKSKKGDKQRNVSTIWQYVLLL